jgi:transcriptional regulator with XRE-family HTH domain
MMVRSVKDLGALVPERRNRLGLSQSDLASKFGVQRHWVSQFKSGKSKSHVGLVMPVLRALDLELQVGPAPDAGPGDSERQIDLNALSAGNLNPATE